MPGRPDAGRLCLLLALAACAGEPEGLDADHDGYDVGLDCDDEDINVFPGGWEICGDGAVNDCNGSAAAAMAECGMGGDLSLSEADLTLRGLVWNATAGWDVAGEGDVDGDGRGDVLIGAPYLSQTDVAAGVVALLLASGALDDAEAELSLKDADLLMMGAAANDWAGWSVSFAGDVDGDGLDDLLVGAPGDASGGYDAGMARLVLGSTALSIAPGTMGLAGADAAWRGEVYDRVGTAVAGAGDVDGDGLADMLFGADGDQATTGMASLLYGGDLSLQPGSRPISEAGLTLEGPWEGGSTGTDACGAGDTDGDGLADLLIGGPWSGLGGMAWLVLGGGLPAGGEVMALADADLTVVGVDEDAYTGGAVGGGADVDGDGLDDLVVAAFYGGGRGQTGLFLTSNLDPGQPLRSLSNADILLVGDSSLDESGFSAHLVRDADGDGRADLILGASWDDEGAYLMWSDGLLVDGSGTFGLSSADLFLQDVSSGDRAGFAISGVYDQDGDGLDELLIGAPHESTVATLAGAAYLIHPKGY